MDWLVCGGNLQETSSHLFRYGASSNSLKHPQTLRELENFRVWRSCGTSWWWKSKRMRRIESDGECWANSMEPQKPGQFLAASWFFLIGTTIWNVKIIIDIKWILRTSFSSWYVLSSMEIYRYKVWPLSPHRVDSSSFASTRSCTCASLRRKNSTTKRCKHLDMPGV